MNHLTAYGWNAHFAAQLERGESADVAARVIQEHKEAYFVHSAAGNIWAEISGKMRHAGAVRADFPSVGDWVMLRGLEHVQEKNAGGPVQIYRILPRRTTLARRLEADEQILATNVDVAFLGTSLNENFNLRRLERYLTLARESGAQPVILLTKADLCEEKQPLIEEVAAVAAGAPIHPISVVTGEGMEQVRNYLQPGTTSVILGSSGIGKSTLVNYLADADIQDMMEARDFDDKGRHCTTFRHLVRTPTGGLIIDTPGLRGLSLGEATDALISTFADVEALASSCRFSNCQHDTEPGCAIKAALESNTLDPERLDSYLKLQREVTAMAQRENRIAERKQKKLEKKSNAQREKREQKGWHKHRR
ncbi:MAG: ribosome small subunit-dependent GTPase A [Phycisphaerae bacterium]